MKLTSARILVVDDDAVMRTYVVNSLRRMGIQTIETCADGTSALEMIKSFKPDLVLTDIHMDPMDGLEFVRQLRVLPDLALRKTRIIFMSADASSGTLAEALPLGTFGYIVKPPRPETLQAKLELALK
ncbi:MAG: response regulator [Rhodoferax sp.]|uniref:response regulator n=1 Tax=Rhodoferax sp. TaxID=50421 RepID=UPI00301B352C